MEELIYEVYGSLPRQGPGDDASTGRALALMTELPENAGVANRVRCVVGDMNDLRFDDGSFDAIWSEGAIYRRFSDEYGYVFYVLRSAED